MDITISKMALSDLLQIQDILVSEFDNFWSFNILKSELENKNSQYLVAKFNNEIVGFAGIWKSIDDVHITNIVTKKSYRNNGIASKLLEKLIELAKKENVLSLTLEVNDNNIYAIKLYEKYKFKKIGLRKNYYSQNENAIIMTLYF